MTDTVCVLALDAADYRLAREWDCQNILLDEHRELETFAYSLDHPYTPEVWATVATGAHPEDHGIGAEKQESEWGNSLLRLASRLTQHLSPRTRQALGRPFRVLGASQTFQQVTEDVDHPFDDALSWPGITPAEQLREAWRLADDADRGDLAIPDLERRLQRLAGQQLGYLAAMHRSGCALVGAHCHTLDIAGHVYCEQPAQLAEWYDWMDQQVARLRDRVDQLLLLSDHGMETVALDDDNPGHHSYRALASSQGLQGPLPDSVFEVREHLEGWAGEPAVEPESVEMDTDREHLEALGYV
jgi:hypothetical protein